MVLSACAAPLPHLAVPSFVLPDSVAGNAFFLAGKVDEISLMFLETEACLRYTARDLPPELAALPGRSQQPLRWHVHLPVDLPWPQRNDARQCRKVGSLAAAVAHKAAFLHPWCAVLHPPRGSVTFQRFALCHAARAWYRACSVPLFVENTPYADVLSLGTHFLKEHGLAFCLDVAHALGYAQYQLLQSPWLEEARLVHWSAPAGGDRHRALQEWTAEEKKLVCQLVPRLSSAQSHVLEMFQWQRIEQSWPFFIRLFQEQTCPDQQGLPFSGDS